MHYQISHHTRYQFDRPVFLEPQLIRLQPRADGAITVQSHVLRIDPKPVRLSYELDPQGNVVAQAWFHDITDYLDITSELAAQTHRANPFDFLVPPYAVAPPAQYRERDMAFLGAYLRRVEEANTGDRVEQFAAEVSRESGGQVVGFLIHLTHRLFDRTKIVIREEGAPQPPMQTFDSAQGACRDLTRLFVDTCRCVGIAARFVSGYQAGDPDQNERHLHAWPEAFVPHGGWRGFDPTLGLAVAGDHLPLAAAYNPEDAAPVSGTYRGTAVGGTITTHIDLASSHSGGGGRISNKDGDAPATSL